MTNEELKALDIKELKAKTDTQLASAIDTIITIADKYKDQQNTPNFTR